MPSLRVVAGIVAAATVMAPPARVAVTATSLLTVGCSVFDAYNCTAGSVLPESLPHGRVGQAYFLQLDVERSGDACEKPEYEILGGQLPPGMKLSEDGALDGMPTEAGVFGFQVFVVLLSTPSTAGDIAQESAGKSYGLTVLPR